MLLRSLTAIASALSALAITSQVCMAGPKAPASLSPKTVAKNLPIYYPVQPGKISLFGEISPSPLASAQSSACLSEGSWGMFWVPALSHAQIHIQGPENPGELKVRRLSGPTPLQGILAIVEHPIQRGSAGVDVLFNSDTVRRAFLVSSDSRTCIQIQRPTRQSPDLAWSRAWQHLSKIQDPLSLLPLRWFEQDSDHPLWIQHFARVQAFKELLQDFPESWPFVKWLASLHRLDIALQLQPSQFSKFREEHLFEPTELQKKIDPDFSNPDHPFSVASPGKPLQIKVQGPGSFELRAQVLAPAHTAVPPRAPTIHVKTAHRRIADLTLLSPKPHQVIPSLGPIRRHRFWLPKGAHQIAIDTSPSTVRLSLRKAQRVPSLSTFLRHKTPLRALRKARRELKALKKIDSRLSSDLTDFLSPWTPQTLAKHQTHIKDNSLCSDARPWLCAYWALNLAKDPKASPAQVISSAKRACQQLQDIKGGLHQKKAAQYQLAKLAGVLWKHRQAHAAKQCLGHPKAIMDAEYLAASLRYQIPMAQSSTDPLVLTGMEWFKKKPSSQLLKSTYLRRRRTQNKKVSVKPQGAESLVPIRWLHPVEKDAQVPRHRRVWRKIDSKRPYILAPQPTGSGQAQTLRVLIALPKHPSKDPEHKKVQLSLGSKTYSLQLQAKQQVFHWIVSPHEQELRFRAPPGTQVLCDQPVQPREGGPVARFVQRQFWPNLNRPASLRFDLGQYKSNAPISVSFRVQVAQNTRRRQVLPLSIQTEDRNALGLWLHYDPQTLDSKLAIEKALKSSYPVSVQLGVLDSPSVLKIVPHKKETKLWVSLQRTQGRTSQVPITTAPPEATEAPIIIAQGPASLREHINRAKDLLHTGQRKRLRDELEWIAHSKDSELQDERARLATLLRQIGQQPRTSLFSLTDPQDCTIDRSAGVQGKRHCREETGVFSMRAEFLDQHPLALGSSTSKVHQQLQAQADSLDLENDDSILGALSTISSYLRQPSSEQRSSASDALVFGMLDGISKRISGGVLSAWRGIVARKTRWKNIEFASQSAGHEWIETPGHSKNPLFSAPWQDPTHTLALSEHQQRVFLLTRSKPTTLRLQAYCKATRPQNPGADPILSFKLNRGPAHAVSLSDGPSTQHPVSIPAGKTRLTLRGEQEQSCLLRVLEQMPDSQTWSPIDLTGRQRWFLVKAHQPAVFHSRGPGTLRLQLRRLDPNAKVGSIKIESQGPSSTNFSKQLKVDTPPDAQAKLQRDPKISSSHPTEFSTLMSQPGVYRYQVQSDGPEYLIRAQNRVPAQTRPAKQRTSDVIESLRRRLSSTSSPIPVHARNRPNTMLRQASSEASKRSGKGIWQLEAGAGLLSDLDYDQANSRWSTQLQGSWFASLVPNRLWLKTGLTMSSEDRVVPAGKAQLRLYASNQRAWLRGQLEVFGASQYLHRFAHRYAFLGRIEFSLRSLRARPAAWDLLADLRASYHRFSKSTLDIADSLLGKALHRYVYRDYVKEHPLSLRPRIQLVWRKFYDIRAYAGQDLWFNSDLKSIDRTRSWLKISGLLGSYRTKHSMFWTYDAGYRFSYALADLHRNTSFLRSEFMLNLKSAFRINNRSLWEISAGTTVFTQSEQPTSLRFLLSAGIAFDRAGPLAHRPIQLRRYPRELRTGEWFDPQTQSKENKNAAPFQSHGPNSKRSYYQGVRP